LAGQTANEVRKTAKQTDVSFRDEGADAVELSLTGKVRRSRLTPNSL
jgi:hypothetical protein